MIKDNPHPAKVHAGRFSPLHGLRHTFASMAVFNGVPLSRVQKLLAHKDPSLTQRYVHLEDSALKNSASSLVGDLLTDAAQSGGESDIRQRHWLERFRAYPIRVKAGIIVPESTQEEILKQQAGNLPFHPHRSILARTTS